MTDRVLAVRAPADYGTSEMLGSPGMFRTWIDGKGDNRMDVCCPGCGKVCWSLNQKTHPLMGNSIGPQIKVHPSVCCGWNGRLTGGWWVTSGQ